MVRPTAVIVLAAGQGTRMRSDLPKVLHPLGGLSMIGHALRAAAGVDPERVLAVVRHQREVVIAEARACLPDVLIADQDDVPGTGRAVQCALAALDEAARTPSGTVLVTCGDVPLLEADTLRDLLAVHEDGGHAVTVLTTVVADPTGYGRIVRGTDGRVEAIVEQRDATDEQAAIREINAGVYAFDLDFLRSALAGLGTDNDQGEVYLTDVVAAAASAGRMAGALVLEDTWQAEGCNDRVQLAVLAAELRRRLNERHMRDGVTIVDPASTWIDVDVTIGRDTVVHPGTTLRRGTSIGEKCEIGPSTVLEAVTVGDRAHLPATWACDVTVPADTMGAPFSVIGRQTGA